MRLLNLLYQMCWYQNEAAGRLTLYIPPLYNIWKDDGYSRQLQFNSHINCLSMLSIFNELGPFKSKKEDTLLILDRSGKHRQDLLPFVLENFKQEVDLVKKKRESQSIFIAHQEYIITLESLLKIRIL